MEKRGMIFRLYHRILIISIIFMFVFFLYFLLNYPFTITGQGITETVESANDVGQYSSIAIDSDNKIHISYIDATSSTSSDLKYCNNTAGSWSCAIAELGGAEERGKYSSIAIDSDNKIHISHYDNTNDDLRYCNNTGGSWSCTTVETTNDVGSYSSIAIDSDNKVHISHYDATAGVKDLRYCNNTAGSWSCVAIFPDISVDKGKYSSIAIDSNNNVHISNYQEGGSNNLKYCNNTAGSWSCTNVDSTGDVGKYSSIAIDSNNKVHISHQKIDGGGISSLRYCNNTAGSWGCVDVETTNDIGLYTSIAIDSNDKIHISHYDATNDDLRYCNNINGTWVCSKLADADSNQLGTPNGRALAIKKGRIVDSTAFSGKLHISWYNNTDLLYTSHDPFYPTLQFESLTTVTGNYSKNYIEINITASDTNAIDTITIYLYNSTSLVQRNISSTSPFFVNFTDLPDETYKLNASVNDTEGNENSTETRTVILDTINPTATFTCSPSSVTVGKTVTCTCSGTDNDGGVGLNDSATSADVTITTNKTGAITQTGCSVTDLAGNSASADGNYTVKSSSVPIEYSLTPVTQQVHSWTEITPESGVTITDFDEDIGIKGIQIEVNEEVKNVKVTVSKYDSKPASVSVEILGSIYRYIEIETENLEGNLEKAIITIQVEKLWTSDNNLKKGQIAMFKFDENFEEWNELPTDFISEDAEFYFYDVELDSFSFFVIGEKIKEESEEQQIGKVVEKGFFETINEKVPTRLWWIFVLILAIVVIVFLIVRKRKKRI